MTTRVYNRPGWRCDCGCPNGHWRTTCYRCDQPRPPKEQPVVCGKRVVRVGWGYAYCLLAKGHKGACQ